MLLHSLDGASLSSAMYTFPVSENNEVQVFEECLEVYYQMLLVWDEQPVGLLHVHHAVSEAWRECGT